MPFVTEELWQRLPRRAGDDTPSIMVSRFPVFEKEFVFERAEKEFDLVFGAIRTGRSLASQYNIQGDVKCECLFFFPFLANAPFCACGLDNCVLISNI